MKKEMAKALAAGAWVNINSGLKARRNENITGKVGLLAGEGFTPNEYRVYSFNKTGEYFRFDFLPAKGLELIEPPQFARYIELIPTPSSLIPDGFTDLRTGLMIDGMSEIDKDAIINLYRYISKQRKRSLTLQ